VDRPIPVPQQFTQAPGYNYGTSFGTPNFQVAQGSWGQSGWGGIAPATWGRPHSDAGTTVQWFADRISRVSAQIAENENKGRLTTSDAGHLRVKLQEVGNLLDSARKDSVIDDGEAKTISERLNGLSDDLKKRGIDNAAAQPTNLAPSYPTVGLPSTPGYIEHTLGGGGYEFGPTPNGYGTSFGAPAGYGQTPYWSGGSALSAQWGMPSVPGSY